MMGKKDWLKSHLIREKSYDVTALGEPFLCRWLRCALPMASRLVLVCKGQGEASSSFFFSTTTRDESDESVLLFLSWTQGVEENKSRNLSLQCYGYTDLDLGNIGHNLREFSFTISGFDVLQVHERTLCTGCKVTKWLLVGDVRTSIPQYSLVRTRGPRRPTF